MANLTLAYRDTEGNFYHPTCLSDDVKNDPEEGLTAIQNLTSDMECMVCGDDLLEEDVDMTVEEDDDEEFEEDEED